MELLDLGFTDWFKHKQKEYDKPGHSVGRVTAVNKGGYLVRNEHGEVLAELAGSFMFFADSIIDFPVVGDWAFVQYYNSNSLAIIESLFPRKSVLRRKAAGKKVDYQMIASNIDVAFIFQSCDFDFNLRRLERYLVMANDGDIEPMLLLSKIDLVSQEYLEQRISEIRSAGIKCEIIAYSNETGLGLPLIRQVLESGKTYCLLGSSGVGKTTLGRHTTARRQLVVLDQGAMFIDTPGMRELGNIGVNTGVEKSFSDIIDLSKGCRFNDCTHTSEVGCSVRRALQNGDLNEARYHSYLKLTKESEYYQMSYVEKRKKDKNFGQFIKSVMKQNKKT
jgi:ribosome biogenesis GTPase